MEKAFLVGVNLNDGEDYLLSLEELDALAQACDIAPGTPLAWEMIR